MAHTPKSFPVPVHPAAKLRVPTAVAPDIALAQPVGTAGQGPASGGGAFGQNPPATYNHWLAGVGKHVMPGPAMQGTGTELWKTGFYARRQANNTWHRFHGMSTTIH